MDVLEHKTEISTEKLIQAVKKRTVLYSKDNPNYHLHGKFKGKIWKEVCREVFPDWCDLSPRQKVEYAHYLQRRWKSLRTCFAKELSQQKKDRENSSGNSDFKRRRKYIYFDQLSFLVNPEDIPEAADAKISIEEDSTDPLEPEMLQLESEGSTNEESSSKGFNSQHYQIEEEPFKSNVFQRDQDVVEIMGNMKKYETEDEDRQFVLSIVPALRKLNDKQKFDAKIEILMVLKKISTAHDLQRRWKNLRTCFTRELSLQRKELKNRENSSGDPDFKRRRKYIFFDQLSFLVNPEEIPETPNVKMSIEEDSTDPLEPEMFQLESEESAYEESSSKGFSSQRYVQIEEEPFQSNVFQRDQDDVQIMGNMKKHETEDEDRQFVLSIVPALRKLNDKQKFDAKIEILKVLKKISTGED